jgi:hypothetical protein
VLILPGASGARADAIDGAWCLSVGDHTGGKRMEIAGPDIVTPNGTKTEGDYRRHFFSYVIPPSDPDAGMTVQMRLLDESTVQLRRVPGPSPIETWLRCGKEISALVERSARS